MKRSRTSAGPLIIVIKLGTSSIIHETTHQPLLSLLSSIVETVVLLRSHGHKVVLVSSGAIGVGMKRMELPGRPKSLSGRQALAAIGQGRLIALWDNLFSQLGQPIAQVLLTRGDIADRTRYLNAANTFTELFNMGVVPIVNENDTVSVAEIRFGDNDTLSAITSAMIHADYLFLLTDVDGLYTSNPRKNPLARPIEVVTSITAIRNEVSTATLGSKLGTGGMETKLIAAEIATAAGVATIITNSRNPQNIFRILEYNISQPRSNTNSFFNLPDSSTSSSDSADSSVTITSPPTLVLPTSSGDTTGASTPIPTIRPPHTLFVPSDTPLRDLKSWTFHTLAPSGSVIIDTGAHHVLSRRDSGGRLLAAGVLGVRGDFASGQAVRVVIRRKRDGAHSHIVDPHHARVDPHLMRMEFSAGSPMTFPDTPLILPASRSTLDSISTLAEGLLGSAGISPVHAFASGHSSGDHSPFHRHREGSLSMHGQEGMSTSKLLEVNTKLDATPTPGNYTPLPEVDSPTEKDDEIEGYDIIEVGRGLANYNSAEIRKVRGLKSSHIAKVLGYADSEYVVENITIKAPP